MNLVVFDFPIPPGPSLQRGDLWHLPECLRAGLPLDTCPAAAAPGKPAKCAGGKGSG